MAQSKYKTKLLDLPNEVLVQIFQRLETKNKKGVLNDVFTVVSFRDTCLRFREIAVNHTSLHFVEDYYMDLSDPMYLLNHLQQPPLQQTWIHRFHIRMRPYVLHRFSPGHLQNTLSMFLGMEHLKVSGAAPEGCDILCILLHDFYGMVHHIKNRDSIRSLDLSELERHHKGTTIDIHRLMDLFPNLRELRLSPVVLQYFPLFVGERMFYPRIWNLGPFRRLQRLELPFDCIWHYSNSNSFILNPAKPEDFFGIFLGHVEKARKKINSVSEILLTVVFLF